MHIFRASTFSKEMLKSKQQLMLFESIWKLISEAAANGIRTK